MELRKLNDFEYQKSIDLCRLCFNNEILFISYDDFVTDNSLGVFDGDLLVSVLYVKDRTLMLNGEEYKSCVITACATRKEYRNHGCMTKLLEIEAELLNKKDYVFCFVNPIEYGYFVHRGWKTVSYCNRYEIEPVNDAFSDVTMFIDSDRMKTVYDGYTIGRSHFLRDDADFSSLINTVDSNGGQVMLTDDFYVFFSLGDYIDVFEHTCTNEIQLNRMISLLSGFGKKIRYFVPASYNDLKKEDKTMVRLIKNVFDSDEDSVLNTIRLSNPIILDR